MMTGTTALGPMYPTIPHIRTSVDGGGGIGELVVWDFWGRIDGEGLPLGGIGLVIERSSRARVGVGVLQDGSRMRLTFLRLGVFGLVCAVGSAQDVSLSPYVVDHFARRDSAADARFLLDAPAGKHGFVTVRDGHLYTERWEAVQDVGGESDGVDEGVGAAASA